MSDLVSVPCPLSDPAHNWSHLRISSEYCIAGTVYCVVDLYIVHACVEMSVPGGTGKVQEVTAEVTELAQMVQAEVKQKSGRQFSEYTPTEFRSQLVAGVNYFIKVKVSDDECVHLRVYRDLKGDVSLSNFLLNKSPQDPLEYFQ